MNFTSDNTSGAHPAIMEALVKANRHGIASYGADELTKRVEQRFSALFEREAKVFFVATGTAANALSLAACIPPWGTVLCHEEAHIVGDECGAPEFYSHGGKIMGLAGENGKLTVAALTEALRHKPAHAVSLSQATECGTVYTLDEIAAIAAFCKSQNLPLHMDGARFANALVSLGCTAAELTQHIDILSFGATKNGCLMAEAIVVFTPLLAETIPFRQKRAGQTISKHWLITAQFEVYLANDLWLDNARHANAMAQKLAKELIERGIKLAWPVDANEVFAILPKSWDEQLRSAGAKYHDWPYASLENDEILIRLVTSFATTEAEIQAFMQALPAR